MYEYPTYDFQWPSEVFREGKMKTILLLKAYRLYFFSLIFLLVVAASFIGTENSNRWNVKKAVGTCGGFGVTFINEIPTAVFPAIDKYFNGVTGGAEVGNYATAVDPTRESTVPHVCLGLGDSLDQGYGNVTSLTGAQLVELKEKRLHYTGVVPPGATKALELNVSYTPTLPLNLQGDVILKTYLASRGGSVSLGRTVIVAYYPKTGWRVVYSFGLQHGGYATS